MVTSGLGIVAVQMARAYLRNLARGEQSPHCEEMDFSVTLGQSPICQSVPLGLDGGIHGHSPVVLYAVIRNRRLSQLSALNIRFEH